jgi:predicted double-glycine peptidase
MQCRFKSGRLFILFALASLCVTMSSCVTPPVVQREGTVSIEGMPFFKQDAYQCGPAALAMVIDYWYEKTGKGPRVTPEQIVPDIYSPTARGVLGMDLAIYARKQGFATREFSGTVEELKALVDERIPPLILVDFGFSLYQVNHFVVVIGYNRDGVIVTSGQHENQFIREGELTRIWRKTGNWTLVIKPSA